MRNSSNCIVSDGSSSVMKRTLFMKVSYTKIVKKQQNVWMCKKEYERHVQCAVCIALRMCMFSHEMCFSFWLLFFFRGYRSASRMLLVSNARFVPNSFLPLIIEHCAFKPFICSCVHVSVYVSRCWKTNVSHNLSFFYRHCLNPPSVSQCHTVHVSVYLYDFHCLYLCACLSPFYVFKRFFFLMFRYSDHSLSLSLSVYVLSKHFGIIHSVQQKSAAGQKKRREEENNQKKSLAKI